MSVRAHSRELNHRTSAGPDVYGFRTAADAATFAEILRKHGVSAKARSTQVEVRSKFGIAADEFWEATSLKRHVVHFDLARVERTGRNRANSGKVLSLSFSTKQEAEGFARDLQHHGVNAQVVPVPGTSPIVLASVKNYEDIFTVEKRFKAHRAPRVMS